MQPQVQPPTSTIILTAQPSPVIKLTPTDTSATPATPPSTPENKVARDFPFHWTEPKFPLWKVDIADPGNNYHIHKQVGDKDPYKNQEIPTVFFTPEILRETDYIVKRMTKLTGECAGFMLLEQLHPSKPHFLAYHQFMVGQIATTSEVELVDKDMARYRDHLLNTYPERFTRANLSTKMMHFHSHGNLGIFWSGVDRAQQMSKEQLGFQGQYRFYSVFNAQGSLKMSYVQYQPVILRIEDVSVGWYYGDPRYNTVLNMARKAELDKVMDDLVMIHKSAPPTYAVTNLHFKRHASAEDDQYTESYDLWPQDPRRPAKNWGLLQPELNGTKTRANTKAKGNKKSNQPTSPKQASEQRSNKVDPSEFTQLTLCDLLSPEVLATLSENFQATPELCTYIKKVLPKIEDVQPVSAEEVRDSVRVGMYSLHGIGNLLEEVLTEYNTLCEYEGKPAETLPWKPTPQLQDMMRALDCAGVPGKFSDSLGRCMHITKTADATTCSRVVF